MKAIKKAIQNFTAFEIDESEINEHIHMADVGGKRASRKDLGYLLKF